MKLVAQKIHQKTHVFTNVESQFFSKLVNWSSGYFDLFLQENLKSRLIIYYPNGNITIQYYRDTSELKITVENKQLKDCIEFSSRILRLYQSLNETNNQSVIKSSFNKLTTTKRHSV